MDTVVFRTTASYVEVQVRPRKCLQGLHLRENVFLVEGAASEASADSLYRSARECSLRDVLRSEFE